MAPQFLVLPERFRQSGYVTANKECAWSRQDAIDLIDYLTARGVVVDGIEVWLPTDPGPTIPAPFIYTWGTDITPGESIEAFVARANSDARDFVATFAWDDRDLSHRELEPFFHIATPTELRIESE